MRNKIIFIFIPLIIIVAAVLLFINKKEPAPTVEQNINVQENEVGQNVVVDEAAPIQTSAPTPKDVAWNLFQKYLSYNKELNLGGVKSTVYKVADVCNTLEPTEECKDRMNSAYSYGSVLEKEKFTNVWSEGKQIIISTDFWTEEIKELHQYGRFRAIIYFVKDQNGVWKMLSFSPFKGNALDTNYLSEEEKIEKAILYTKDEDKDGIADYEESCSHKPNDSSCVKTDPEARDTDKDGLWDSIDALMK